mmetsp:Transcript_18872/g.48119  ORF Transcript_18872/g.48119 Transcript_18872/m.48119 type:complete len:200 (+) Transcript_18872:442-1041(+)
MLAQETRRRVSLVLAARGLAFDRAGRTERAERRVRACAGRRGGASGGVRAGSLLSRHLARSDGMQRGPQGPQQDRGQAVGRSGHSCRGLGCLGVQVGHLYEEAHHLAVAGDDGHESREWQDQRVRLGRVGRVLRLDEGGCRAFFGGASPRKHIGGLEVAGCFGGAPREGFLEVVLRRADHLLGGRLHVRRLHVSGTHIA